MTRIVSGIVFCVCVLFLVGCSDQGGLQKVNSRHQKEVVVSLEEQVNISDKTKIADFVGRPSVLIWGGTYCPHCQQMMPLVEQDIYDVYKEDIFVHVTSINGEYFATKVPQDTDNDLRFAKVVGQEGCKYVPSWVILDAGGQVTMQSCGAEKTFDEMKAEVARLVD